MVQFRILTGKMAGTAQVARHFPVRIGRAAESDLRLEEQGVWDRHLLVSFKPREGFELEVQGEAHASVNGQSVTTALLRNGDLIEFGASKIQFWLADTRQRRLRFGEWFVWTLIVLISAAQVGLIYWLLQA